MSISGIQGTVATPYQMGTATNYYAQQLQQLGQALQSGNLSAAQSDFSSLQQAFTQTNPSGSTGSSATSSLSQAISQLGSDLQSGNLSAAQKDFATVEQGVSDHGTLAQNRLFRHQGTSGSDSGSQSQLMQDLSQLGQSLSSNNLTGAQQTYASLEQEMQEFALGGTTASTMEPVSFDA
jgi:hypothetical protein